VIRKQQLVQDKHRGISNLLAFALIPLSGFATDVYLPSMPTMSKMLHISNIQVQFTLTFFLVSYGISQLFIGSILDSFGRYRIGVTSLLIFAMASIAIATTHNIYVIYLMRIIHGITVGGIVVAKRAYFIDLFSGEKLKHYLSLFSIIWSTGPIVAPFIGGYLQSAFGWESNFYFLAAFALAFAILELIFSGESLSHYVQFDIRKIAGVYLEMFKTTSFILGLAMLGFAYSMVMIYNMTGPFIIEHALKLSPIIAGYGSLILGFAWMTGGFIGKATISSPLLKKAKVNLILQLLFAILMLLSVRWVSNIYSLIFFVFLIHVGGGYTFNNFFTYCLGRFPKNGGIVSGLTGGINYVIVSIVSSGVVIAFPAKDEYNLGFSYLMLIIASILTFVLLRKSKDL
jgi:multidrug resistance protein